MITNALSGKCYRTGGCNQILVIIGLAICTTLTACAYALFQNKRLQ